MATAPALWAQGKVPIDGVLRDMYRYFAGGYIDSRAGIVLPTPLERSQLRRLVFADELLSVGYATKN